MLFKPIKRNLGRLYRALFKRKEDATMEGKTIMEKLIAFALMATGIMFIIDGIVLMGICLALHNI